MYDCERLTGRKPYQKENNLHKWFSAAQTTRSTHHRLIVVLPVAPPAEPVWNSSPPRGHASCPPAPHGAEAMAASDTTRAPAASSARTPTHTATRATAGTPAPALVREQAHLGGRPVAPAGGRAAVAGACIGGA